MQTLPLSSYQTYLPYSRRLWRSKKLRVVQVFHTCFLELGNSYLAKLRRLNGPKYAIRHSKLPELHVKKRS